MPVEVTGGNSPGRAAMAKRQEAEFGKMASLREEGPATQDIEPRLAGNVPGSIGDPPKLKAAPSPVPPASVSMRSLKSDLVLAASQHLDSLTKAELLEIVKAAQ